MDQVAAILTLKALDGLQTRAEVTAQNIANANTAGYRPLRANFEDALREAAKVGPDAVAKLQPTIDRLPLGPGESGLRTDLELATASTTTLRYSALIEVLGRQMSMDSLAITGNG